MCSVVIVWLAGSWNLIFAGAYSLFERDIAVIAVKVHRNKAMKKYAISPVSI